MKPNSYEIMSAIDNSKVCVLIPIYKDNLTKLERISFENTIKKLGKFDIILVAPHDLSLNVYLDHALKIAAKKLKIETFNSNFFKGIEGYNNLMLSSEFYSRFLSYEYMLICQLDAYVFDNQLLYWCKMNFDYIGAPILDLAKPGQAVFLETSGNGGFSLRNVKRHFEILDKNPRIYAYKELLEIYRKQFSGLSFWLRIPMIWIRIVFKYKNDLRTYLKDYGRNEDQFWFEMAPRLNTNFKVAKFEVAKQFAFEKHPSILYKLNDNKLPFGCHAFDKYEVDFWKEFISEL